MSGRADLAPSPVPGSPLANVVVVLDQPQNLVNIAGVVRAMKNMGLERLRLVRPAEFDAYRITGIAHRCDDVVDRARIVGRLEDALEDCVHVLGTTARARTAHRNYGRPRDLAPTLVARTSQGPVALLFGREDRGLSNEALDLCDGVAVVPTDPGYPSLNLAQAFLILAYEVFLAAEGDPGSLPTGKRHTRPATREEMERMFTALESGLRAIDFFHARPAENVMRTFRTLLARAEPDSQEAGLVKAMGFGVAKYLDLVRRGVIELPAPEDEGEV
jgi:tRNA/rRNA methyltransferase